MDIRVLRYYLAVCREGTMSRAAEVLHVTQPTLSRQIADLERELGCTLLERRSRSVVPTEQGMYLRRRAEEIVALADQTKADFSHDGAIVEGDVHIGAGESQGVRVIAQRIRAFRERYPQVRFHLHSGSAEETIERLEHGLDDLAVLISHPDINRFAHLRLEPTDSWGVIMREDDPLAQREQIIPADLAGKPLITSKQSIATGVLDQWFGASVEGLNVVATYNLIFNAVALAREGVGYVLALDNLATVGGDTGLVFRPLHPPVISVIDFAWKHGQVFTNAAQLFLESMRNI